MENASIPSGEHERRPVWMDLLEIENKIDTALKRIDASGSDFLAREELLNQLKTKYHWHEKWSSATLQDREMWAKQYQKNYPYSPFRDRTFFMLAEKNYQTAINFHAPRDSKELTDVLNQVENDTIESSAKELEEIKKLIKTTDIKGVARIFLKFISEFKKQILYKELTDDDRSYFETYEEKIESEIDDRDIHHALLPKFIDKLVEIIRSKKK